VFNADKLSWFNAQHIARLPTTELAVRLRPALEAAGLWNNSWLAEQRAWMLAVLELLKPRARTLNDFVEQGRFFFADEIEYDEAAVRRYLHAADLAGHLTEIDAVFAEASDFDPATLEAALRSVAEARGVKAATLIHALRVALTGKAASPGLFEVLALLGRTRVHARIVDAVRRASAPRL
jgi:glutamyl-tRNA synthetase